MAASGDPRQQYSADVNGHRHHWPILHIRAGLHNGTQPLRLRADLHIRELKHGRCGNGHIQAHRDLRVGQDSAHNGSMRPKSLREAGEYTGQSEVPYVCAGAMPGLNEWAMERRGGMARTAVRCLPGRPLARVILTSVLSQAGELAYIGSFIPYLGLCPTVGRSASPEGGTGG